MSGCELFYAERMLRKNSIFTHILVPVIILMLLQTALISMVLFLNGTISSLRDNAVDGLKNNVENRGISIEHIMAGSWSDLRKLEQDVIDVIDAYLDEVRRPLSAVAGNAEHESCLLDRLSEHLLSALRITSSTGVYIIFTDGKPDKLETPLRGLYYRDLDPASTPADYSDIQFLRGTVEIARKDKIQLDSFWSEAFIITSENQEVYKWYINVTEAAKQNPDAKPSDLAYWSTPHTISQSSQGDMNKCITYTKPIFYDGQLIGLIGTEVSEGQLKKLYQVSEQESAGKSGYMLLKYSASEQLGGAIACEFYTVTGSYIKRLLGSADNVVLTPTKRTGVYTIADSDIEDVQIAVRPLHIYNANAPFADEQWALATIGADSVLFGASKKVSSGILISSVIALLAGSVLLAFVVRFSTQPLISIANQIEKSEPDDPIVISKSRTYEVTLLCSTINTMKEKRRNIERALREERERYLIALESAADTFVEYDLILDSFKIYFFAQEDKKPVLISSITKSFSDQVRRGEVCHKLDAKKMLTFLSGETAEPIEARTSTKLFSHITSSESDGEYFWFLYKTSRIYNESGALVKLVGIARNITAEKLRERVQVEASRRDATTQIYNREYGLSLIERCIDSAQEYEEQYAVSVMRIVRFELFEARYGRVYAGVILREICREITGILSNTDIAVRLTNNEFMILYQGVSAEEVHGKIETLLKALSMMYTGEDKELRLDIKFGFAVSDNSDNLVTLTQMAYEALSCAHILGTEDCMSYSEIPPTFNNTEPPSLNRPITVSLDISKDAIIRLAFDIFESTPDKRSGINMLLKVIGQLFELDQIIICSFDPDFGANHAAYQWNRTGIPRYHGLIEKVPALDVRGFEGMLDVNGTVFFNNATIRKCTEGMRKLFCTIVDERVNAFCCVMYENGVHTGRILFKSRNQRREWSGSDAEILREITKIMSANISIDKSNSASRAKSEFLSRVSHEIRTPMNVIIGMTDIAKASANNEARLIDSLGKIDFAAKHLLGLINDVLEMSRIESGKLEIVLAQFSLNAFAKSVETLMRPAAESKRIDFQLDIDIEHEYVIGDEYRLRQVMVNLLGNANKFSDEGDSIKFSLKEDPSSDTEYGYYLFSVSDTGIGIRKEDQASVFNEFEQAKSDGVLTDRQDGTGLGLSISSKIISAMGSQIELESEYGEGSVFFFKLKLRYGAERSGASGDENNENLGDFSTLYGTNVLLVEDNEINAEIAEYVLGEIGLNVDTARNGKEAVEKFMSSEEYRYSAILMDIQMPVMDGLTAAREIRKNTDRRDASAVPILAMTANAFDEDMKKSIDSGMDGHIAKPIDKNKLYDTLKTLIDRYTAERREQEEILYEK